MRLHDEWEQVILGQAVTSRAAYFQTRRPGRGRALTRPERATIWSLIEQYTARLDRLGAETWAQAAERAARYEIERAARVQERRGYKVAAGGRDLTSYDDGSGMRYRDYRYKHIVVDEAQDLRPAHWKMLRAMVEPGPNDLFIAGDTHQRIYDNQVALGSLGINIRGRSARLTLSYRTTREILAAALGVLSDETFDDLDDGTDTLAGYRSILHGPVPDLHGYPSWSAELDALTETIRTWLEQARADAVTDLRGLIAVCVPERDMATEVAVQLASAGITAAELTKDGPRGDGEVHIGTMHRFKGLEYQRLAIAGASDGLIPRTSLDQLRNQDPARYARELRKARSLLFVAATRARDALTITWHGRPSPFLTGLTRT